MKLDRGITPANIGQFARITNAWHWDRTLPSVAEARFLWRFLVHLGTPTREVAAALRSLTHENYVRLHDALVEVGYALERLTTYHSELYVLYGMEAEVRDAWATFEAHTKEVRRRYFTPPALNAESYGMPHLPRAGMHAWLGYWGLAPKREARAHGKRGRKKLNLIERRAARLAHPRVRWVA